MTAVLTDDDISARLQGPLAKWRHDGDCIARTYATQGWKSTLMVANAIGHLCEAAWHHPELVLTYASVVVRLNTHDAGGVTDKDMALASRIEDIVMWRPGLEGGPLEGTPADPRYAHVIYD